MNGLHAVRRLHEQEPKIAIVVLTIHRAEIAAEAFRAGGSGYVLKASAGEELVTAIKSGGGQIVRYESDIRGTGFIVTDDNDRILAANTCAATAFGSPQPHKNPGSFASLRVDEHGWAWVLRAAGSAFPFRLSSAAIRTASGMLHLYAIRDVPARRRT